MSDRGTAPALATRSELFSLTGRTALVTGAGSGIGQRIAIGLAEAGAAVACLDLSDESIAATVASVTDLGGSAIAVRADVTNPADLAAAADRVESQLGPLTLAVNCAGIAAATPAEDLDVDTWNRTIAVNLTGLFLSCQAEARKMFAHGGGAIVNIASISGIIANRGLRQVHYNSSKAGVIQLTKSLAMEWVDRGIRVNAISPGYTATPMNTRPEMVHQMAVFEADVPMQRSASVDEMVGPAVFLASSASSYCTGVNLVVDGGFCCW